MDYEGGRLPREGINVSDESPLWELTVLVGGLVGVALAFVVGTALAVDHLVPLLPAEVEVRIFGGDWLAPDEDESEDPRVPVVQGLVDRLADHWPGHPYRFRVGLLEDDTPNAMAFPGGHVLVTTGLLDAVDSENELALVLGHELGHYHGRDHLRGLGRGLALGLVLSALAGTGADVATSLAGLASDLAGRGFDRDQESDADAFGLALVHAEYGHVAGAFDFFGRLPAEPEETLVGDLAGYLSTHPLNEARIEALRREAARRQFPVQGPLVPLVLPDVPVAEHGGEGEGAPGDDDGEAARLGEEELAAAPPGGTATAADDPTL